MSSTSETLLCRYHYDPLDRLVNCAQPGHNSIARFYRKNRLAAEIQGLLQSTVCQQDGQLTALLQRQGDIVRSTLLATNRQHSVLHSVNGAQRHQRAYMAYGYSALEGGVLGFNGERLDPVTRHYLLGNGYRVFNPVLMRLNSQDSMSPFGEGGLNPYAYCVGDPINLIDPTGHVPIWNFLRDSVSGYFGGRTGVIPTRTPTLAQAASGRRASLTEAHGTSGSALVTAQPVSSGSVFYPARPSELSDLPSELLENIFGRLSGKDLANVARTASRMKDSVDNISALNFRRLMRGPSEHRMPKIDAVGFGEMRGIAPSQAVRSGVTLAQAQTSFPYSMVRLVGRRNVTLYYGANNPHRDIDNQMVVMQIRAANGDW